MHSWETLTKNPREAQIIWEELCHALKEVGREDILSGLAVLDLGGGKGQFSKFLNEQGIFCFSLDRQNWAANPGANQVLGDAYHLPFADQTFNIVHSRGVFDVTKYRRHKYGILLPEIARILRPRGIFSIYGYSSSPPAKKLEQLFGRLTMEEEYYPALWEKK